MPIHEMRSLIRHENWKYVSKFSLVAGLTVFVVALAFHFFVYRSFNQLLFLNNAEFNFVYEVSYSPKKDAFIAFNKSKSVFFDRNLSEKISSNVLMANDSEYTSLSPYSDNYLLEGVVKTLDANEAVITNELALMHQLQLEDEIYTKNISNSSLDKYKIVAIIDNVYTFDKNQDIDANGLIILGPNEAELNNLVHQYYIFSDTLSVRDISSQGLLYGVLDVEYESRRLSLSLLLDISVFIVLVVSIIFPIIILIIRDLQSVTQRRLLLGGQLIAFQSIIVRLSLFAIFFAFFNLTLISVFNQFIDSFSLIALGLISLSILVVIVVATLSIVYWRIFRGNYGTIVSH